MQLGVDPEPRGKGVAAMAAELIRANLQRFVQSQAWRGSARS